MDLKDLVVLANAGFSKAEILGFAGKTQAQQTQAQQTQTQQTDNNVVLDAINKLTATIQASNVQATGNQQTQSRTEKDVMNDLMNIMN